VGWLKRNPPNTLFDSTYLELHKISRKNENEKIKREYMDPSMLENMGQFCFEDSDKSVSIFF